MNPVGSERNYPWSVRKVDSDGRVATLWGDFLEARHRLIVAWVELEGRSCAEIADTLSMTPVQVQLIAATPTTHRGAPAGVTS